MGRKGPEISPEVRNLAVDLHQNGHRLCEISKMLHLPYMTVSNIFKRFLQSGSVENKARSGRPKIVTDRDYRKLERLVKVNRRDSLSDITSKFNVARDRRVYKRTVQHHLSKHGFNRRVSRRRVVIREVNRKKRLSWCLEKHRWLVNGNWDKVIFSDESQIVIRNNNRIYIWRKRGEGYRSDLVPSKANRKFQVMIWGYICWNGVGTLAKVTGNINSEKYKAILEENIWPVIVRHFPDDQYFFQDDNAPVHRSRVLQEYSPTKNLKSFSWAAQSPDLNIIENIWLYIKRKLAYRHHIINSDSDLFREIQRIWMDIPPAYIQSLYLSVPRRIMSVIRLQGHLTKY